MTSNAAEAQVREAMYGENKQEFYIDEVAKCAADFWYWATTYVYVLDTEEGRGIIRFESWHHLREIYRLSLRHKWLIFLKSRQIGVSWLWCALALWEVMFHEARTVAIFSKNGTASTEMKERSKFIWAQLPDWMRLPVGRDNDEVMEFPSMNSKIQSFPATEDAGRMSSATLVIIDEWAFHRYAYKNWGAIAPTAEKAKNLICISTADGRANLYYEKWMEAKNGENDFFPVFISWKARPGRNMEWWARMKRNLGTLLALQEYPLNENDAFLIAGDCFFEVDNLHEMPILSPAVKLDGGAVGWLPPEGQTFVAGIDTALGISKGKNDFSVLQILDRDSGEQAAMLRSRMPLEDWCFMALKLLVRYGSPPVVIEEQPQGLLVARIFSEANYPRVWYRSKNRLWTTTKQNRDMVLNDLAMDIRTHDLEKKVGITLHDVNTLNECLGFAWDEDHHKFQASTGHDDTVMALALANFLRKDRAFSGDYNEPAKPYVKGLWKTARKRLTDVDWSIR